MGVDVRIENHVAILTLDWPAIRNALGPVEGREVRLALESLNVDPEVHAIVIAATAPAFCAGGNLPEIVNLANAGRDAVKDTIYSEFQGIFRAIAEAPVPVIAAVDGPAVGFGCDLALAGSATFIGARGWLAQGWAKVGLIPATGGTLYTMRRGGPMAVWRLLAADRVGSDDAAELGLAISVDEALPAAIDMATRFAALPAESVRGVKKLADQVELRAHLEQAVALQSDLIVSDTFKERASRILNAKR